MSCGLARVLCVCACGCLHACLLMCVCMNACFGACMHMYVTRECIRASEGERKYLYLCKFLSPMVYNRITALVLRDLNIVS